MTHLRTPLRVIPAACVLSLVAFLAAPSPVAAKPGPGSWRGVHWRGPHTAAGKSDPDKLFVAAADLSSRMSATMGTGSYLPDQEARGSEGCTTWLGLEFVGSDEETTDHKWTITTLIHGLGEAKADADTDATAYLDSIQIVQFSGDHENVGLGQIAVEDSGPIRLALGIPPAFRVALDKTARTHKEDDFDVKVARTTQGKGKACRVRIDTWVEATGAVKSTVGNAALSAQAILAGDIEMTGSCVYKKTRVIDRLTGCEWPGFRTTDEYTPPSGGMRWVEDEIPADTPSDEEREGKKEELPTVDAKDLDPEDDDGGEASPTPTTGSDEEPDGTADPSSTPEETPDPVKDPAAGSGTEAPSGAEGEGGQ